MQASEDSIHVIRCDNCHATGAIKDALCSRCIGRGYLWSDGVAFTVCPGGGPDLVDGINPITGKDPTTLACGRARDQCAGCGRRHENIGGHDDRAREMMRRLKESVSGTK